MKDCRRCRRPLPADSFSRDATKPDGLAIYCRVCSKLKWQAWYGRKKDAYKQQRAEKKSAPQRAAERQRVSEWRERNPERVIRQNADYYVRNRDRKRAANSKRSRHAVEQLTDAYVRHVLIFGTSMTPGEVPQALVDAKREHLRLKRFLDHLEK